MKNSRRRLDVDVEELDRVIDGELSAGVRKAGWGDSARRIIGGFDSEEEFVPFVMFARAGGAAA